MQISSACDVVPCGASWPFQTALPPVAVFTEMMDSRSFCLQVCLSGASVYANCRMTSLKNRPGPAAPLPHPLHVCLMPSGPVPSLRGSMWSMETRLHEVPGHPFSCLTPQTLRPRPNGLPPVPHALLMHLYLAHFFLLSKNALLPTCPPTELVTDGQMIPPLLPPPGSHLILSPVCAEHPHKTPSQHESLCVAMTA